MTRTLAVVALAAALVIMASPASTADPGSNGRVVFTRCKSELCDQSADLYSIRSDGTGLRRLTENRSGDGQPAVSPDGRRVAYTCRETSKFADGPSDVCIMDINGKNRTKVLGSKYPEIEPAWSPDGQQLAFAKVVGEYDPDNQAAVKNYEVFVADRDGTDLRQLTDSPGYDGNPQWSPDGTKILFETYRNGRGDLYTVQPDGQGLENLTPAPTSETGGDWSPDGSQIVFSRFEQDDGALGTWNMYIMEASVAGFLNAQRVGTTETSDGINAQFSPDGTKLVFDSLVNHSYTAIFTINLDGTDRTRTIERSRWNDLSPSWQPRP